jgi:glutaconyl-CoA decarboxylase
LKKFHLTVGDKRYEVSAERDAAEPSQLHLTIDGTTHTVQVEEEEAPRSAPGPRPAAPPAPLPSGSGGGGNIVAQIPGTVLSVNVSHGDSVSPGDTLMVLEAMKMENVITADAGGTVQAVHVKKGDKVEAGQEMMVIDS